MNSFNAGSFLENDGKINVSISHAQRQHLAFNKLLAKLDAYRIKNATTKILIVLDEFDKGFDLITQSKTINALRGMRDKYNADIVCITHSLLLIMSVNKVFDLVSKSWVKDYHKKVLDTLRYLIKNGYDVPIYEKA